MGDEFSFSAGGGVHFSKQKLTELIPDKRIVWQVTESNLSFLEDSKEWENTNLVFDILEKENETHLTFTLEGLVPKLDRLYTRKLEKLY